MRYKTTTESFKTKSFSNAFKTFKITSINKTKKLIFSDIKVNNVSIISPSETSDVFNNFFVSAASSLVGIG